jgi:hypothetical protein
MDDDDTAPSTSGRTAAAAAGKAGQNAELYNALGQHNPKKAKADSKKAKRAKADTAAAAAADGDESDFDFDEANDADGLKGSEVGGCCYDRRYFMLHHITLCLRDGAGGGGGGSIRQPMKALWIELSVSLQARDVW